MLRKVGTRPGEKYSLVEAMNKRRNSLAGHSDWCTALLEGKIEGRTRRGRRRAEYEEYQQRAIVAINISNS